MGHNNNTLPPSFHPSPPQKKKHGIDIEFISSQVDWFTHDLEHLMNQQLAKMQQLTAHHYVQERLLNEVVTGATDPGGV